MFNMENDTIKDLSRYFVLTTYQDEGTILLEEYEELESILKRNIYARYIEKARYYNILGKLSDEDYQKLYNLYIEIVFSNDENKDFQLKKLNESLRGI